MHILDFRKRAKKCDENLVNALEKAKLLEAGHCFLTALREVDYDNNALISMEEFKHAFEKVGGIFCLICIVSYGMGL